MPLWRPFASRNATQQPAATNEDLLRPRAASSYAAQAEQSRGILDWQIRQVRRETVRASLRQALEIGFERWARVWTFAVAVLCLGFLALLIWSEMIFDQHENDPCDMPLSKLLEALYIIIAIYIFREDIIRCFLCYNRDRDGPEEPCRIKLFRRLTVASVLLWPVVAMVMLCFTHECEKDLKEVVTALVMYYVVVAVVTVLIPAGFLSVMLILVRRGLVRMPRSATAAPEELADALPKVAFEPAAFNDNDAGAFPSQCSICFDDFDDREPISQTPCPCQKHAFHTECLKGWLHVQRTCPLCRFDVTLSPPDVESNCTAVATA